MSNQTGSRLPAFILLTLCLSLAGCGWHWPWRHRAVPPPAPVHELDIQGTAAILQYWDRNTLLLDLTALRGEGTASLGAAHGWPVRLEFKVQPGSFGQLEVSGLERTLFQVPAQGTGPVVLKLAPGTYAADTRQIAIRWSAAADSAH
jgi:hypothetical protein